MDTFSFSGPAWIVVEDVDSLISEIGSIHGLTLDKSVLVRKRTLPMYDRVELICITAEAWSARQKICYLMHGGSPYRLNGTSPPIHTVNAEAPIQLSDSNVLFYLTFFCLFVHGEEGPFYLFNDLNDELLPNGLLDATPDAKDGTLTPRRLFRSPRLFGTDESGYWKASAMIMYSNVIFTGDFLIKPGGMVELIYDEPLMTELPSRVNLALVATASTL